jgi:uncharacterized membrane protein
MSGQSNVATADRIFGALPYLILIIEVSRYLPSISGWLPFFGNIYVFLLPLIQIYYGVSYGSLAIFLLLYFLVLRNHSISHFIRFNVLQSIMVSVLLTICGLLIYLVSQVPTTSSLILIFQKVIFLGTWAIALFGIVSSALGQYADVPQISENVHVMVDRM